MTATDSVREDTMRSATIFRNPAYHVSCGVLAIIAVVLVTLWRPPCIPAAQGKQKRFASPEAAVQAFIQAGRQADKKALLEIFGPEGKDLIDSGDAVADRQNREAFLARYDEAHALVPNPDGSMTLQIGTQEWPFPIPLVKHGKRWRFDTPAGFDEILNRRIGENELSAIQVCLAIVDAQREYAMKDWDGDGLHPYAEKFVNDAGKKNGLYWQTQEGEEPSPLGALFLKASQEGYSYSNPAESVPQPYHGYYYRLLQSQGEHAPGGAFDYMVQGKMLGGFAVVAYPADHGNSGVMTFLVNHEGVVYQKNLGPDTVQIASTMSTFDPDDSWEKAD
jgi:Protein of unknown function (DUF2950)